MNAVQIGLSIILAGFLCLTGYTIEQHGYLGFFQLMLANAATVTGAVDLLIALTLVIVWMQRDARQRGVTALPYTLLTVLLGSVGPLLYLIRRAGQSRAL